MNPIIRSALGWICILGLHLLCVTLLFVATIATVALTFASVDGSDERNPDRASVVDQRPMPTLVYVEFLEEGSDPFDNPNDPIAG